MHRRKIPLALRTIPQKVLQPHLPIRVTRHRRTTNPIPLFPQRYHIFPPMFRRLTRGTIRLSHLIRLVVGQDRSIVRQPSVAKVVCRGGHEVLGVGGFDAPELRDEGEVAGGAGGAAAVGDWGGGPGVVPGDGGVGGLETGHGHPGARSPGETRFARC